MMMFDISDDEMINLEKVEYVKFGKPDGAKSVVVGIGSRTFIIPKKKHKEFFQKLMKAGMTNKQFVSL